MNCSTSLVKNKSVVYYNMFLEMISEECAMYRWIRGLGTFDRLQIIRYLKIQFSAIEDGVPGRMVPEIRNFLLQSTPLEKVMMAKYIARKDSIVKARRAIGILMESGIEPPDFLDGSKDKPPSFAKNILTSIVYFWREMNSHMKVVARYCDAEINMFQSPLSGQECVDNIKTFFARLGTKDVANILSYLDFEKQMVEKIEITMLLRSMICVEIE